VQEAHEVGDLLGEIFRAPVLAKGARRHLVAPGRAADPEIDAPGEERFQDAEALGDLERAVVLEHDTPEPTRIREVRAATCPIRTSGLEPASPGVGVVLGQPVAVIPEAVADLGELECLVDRVAAPPPRTGD